MPNQYFTKNMQISAVLLDMHYSTIVGAILALNSTSLYVITARHNIPYIICIRDFIRFTDDPEEGQR